MDNGQNLLVMSRCLSHCGRCLHLVIVMVVTHNSLFVVCMSVVIVGLLGYCCYSRNGWLCESRGVWPLFGCNDKHNQIMC
jgi:hypothetical protein